MSTYYAVIDTNTLVSAMLKMHSIPGRVVQLCLNGMIVPLYNEIIKEEYSKVLHRKRFNFEEEDICDLLSNLLGKGIQVSCDPQNWNLPDASDAVFFEVVMEHRKTEEHSYLVTGNLRHFPGRAFVVTPYEMLQIIANDLLLEHFLYHTWNHTSNHRRKP